MIEKLIEEFAQSYTFDAIENKEFDSFKVNGMDFEVKAYDAQFLGRVSSMKGKMKFGLMKMETLIVNPLELDVPLLSLDLVQVPGKLIVILEQYDTLANARRNESVFLNIKEKYEDLEDRPSKSAWYDELRYSSSIGKKISKKKADRAKEMIEEYFEAYLDLCRDARVIGKEEKKVKADLYRDGLLENGGASTDSFLKAWGKEKTERFFKEVLFG